MRLLKDDRRYALASLLASCALSMATLASAQQPTSTDETIAASLFQQGRELMAAGKIEEACAKLEESERLVSAAGTLLNLAVCHERQGKTATAWAEFRQSLAWARRDGRSDRASLAEDHMRSLEPHLPRMTLVVSPETARIAGLRIEVDGTSVGAGAWGTPFAVDPGHHAVTAAAPGRTPWSVDVKAASDASASEVVVPPLVEVPAPPSIPPEAHATEVGAPSPPAPPSTWTHRRVAALTVAGGGVLELGLGAYFGLRAFSLRSDSNANCQHGCTAQGVFDNDDAIRAAGASTALFTAGVLTVAASVYLWLTGGAREGENALLVPIPGGMLGRGSF